MTTVPGVAKFAKLLSAAERRRSPRVTLRKGGLPVICRRGSQILVSKANGLGEFGAFVFTSRPFPVGSSFALELGFHSNVHVPARVRSISTSNGMGVEFEVTDEDSRNRLRRWMDRTQVQLRGKCA
jgi:hypothetical protein